MVDQTGVDELGLFGDTVIALLKSVLSLDPKQLSVCNVWVVYVCTEEWDPLHG